MAILPVQFLTADFITSNLICSGMALFGIRFADTQPTTL